MSTDVEDMKAKVREFATDHHLRMEPTFIGGTDDHGNPGLKWAVSLFQANRLVLNCTFFAGISHCPGYPNRIAYDECKTGKHYLSQKPILPDLADVLSSVALDGRAIDHPQFEDWAGEYGYDTDSRKAEAMYRECVKHGLALRAALGEDGLSELNDLVNQW